MPCTGLLLTNMMVVTPRLTGLLYISMEKLHVGAEWYKWEWEARMRNAWSQLHGEIHHLLQLIRASPAGLSGQDSCRDVFPAFISMAPQPEVPAGSLRDGKLSPTRAALSILLTTAEEHQPCPWEHSSDRNTGWAWHSARHPSQRALGPWPPNSF